MSAKREERKDPDKSKQPQELVVVFRALGLLEANVIKGKLESMGIPAALKYESAGPVMGILISSMGEVKVLVPKDREQQAREALGTD